jgi:hypothetical protein
VLVIFADSDCTKRSLFQLDCGLWPKWWTFAGVPLGRMIS